MSDNLPKGPYQEAIAVILQGAGRMLAEAWDGDDVGDAMYYIQATIKCLRGSPTPEDGLMALWAFAYHFDHSVNRTEQKNIKTFRDNVRNACDQYGLLEEVQREGDARGQRTNDHLEAQELPPPPF